MIFIFSILSCIFLFLPSLPLQALIRFPTQFIPLLALILFLITTYKFNLADKSFSVSSLTKLIVIICLVFSASYLLINRNLVGALRLLMVVPFALLSDIVVQKFPVNVIFRFSTCLLRIILVSCITAFAIQIFTRLGCWFTFEAFNMNQRIMCFGYTSFSPILGGLTFRPSFLFDEPGGLILILATVIAISNLSVFYCSLLVLFLSILTSSLGGIVALSFTLLLLFIKFACRGKYYYTLKFPKKRLFMYLLIFSLAGLFIYSSIAVLAGNFESRFLGNVSNSSDVLFSGDNRTSSMISTLDNLNSDIFWNGAIYYGVPEGIGNTGGDILTPLWFYGVLHWMFYLCVLLFVLYLTVVCILKNKSYSILFSVAFLFVMLLSRPHIQWYPYSAPCFLAVYFLYKRIMCPGSPLKTR